MLAWWMKRQILQAPPFKTPELAAYSCASAPFLKGGVFTKPM
jgi:hypothetical protein